MPTTLSELRRDTAQRLTDAGVPGYGYVPERVTPPAAVVLPDEPYLASDDTSMCGTFRARLRVVVLGGIGTNELAADQLDQLVVTAVTELDRGGFEALTVSEPAEVELNGAGYLGTVISVETLTTLETLS
jgi:hypothetical protein